MYNFAPVLAALYACKIGHNNFYVNRALHNV